MVRKSGCYDGVSENDLWDFVAEECGLSIGALTAIKLVYLIEFDQWIWQVKWNNNLENEEVGVLRKLGLLEGFRFSASSGKDIFANESEIENSILTDRQRKIFIGLTDRSISEVMKDDVEGNDTKVDTGKGEGGLNLFNGEGKSKLEQNVGFKFKDRNSKFDVQDSDENCKVDAISIISRANTVVRNVIGSRNDNRCMLTAKGVVERVIGSHKRKRESSSSLLPMLNWLAHAAKNSNDPAVGIIPETSKWKDYGSEELWKQALLARKVLMIRRHVDSGIEESLLQDKLRMLPSMYEDNNILNRQSSDHIRSGNRLPLAKSSLCPCCKSFSTPCKKEVDKQPSKDRDSTAVEALTPKMQTCAAIDKPPLKRISVGPLFQADVPAWTGQVFESDSKWLGTRMWPPQGEHKHVARNRKVLIGKGRERYCLCRLPGSTDCVRFHIAENRVKLSLELGPLFHRWKFNRMGEEVSLSWTIEEEKRFKHMVMSNTTSLNKFWRNAFKLFPSKNREKLVSYYFNVFVIRRRNYQNRVTPNQIDSDDDETEVGCVGDNFGYEKVHAPCIKCSQNMQRTDFN